MAGDAFESAGEFWFRASRFARFVSEFTSIAARRLLGSSTARARRFSDRMLRIGCMVGPQVLAKTDVKLGAAE
jgi:hypothetical protein